MRPYAEASRRRIVREIPCADEAELNSAEDHWQHRKQHGLMGFCAREFWQLSAMARMALESVKEKGD